MAVKVRKQDKSTLFFVAFGRRRVGKRSEEVEKAVEEQLTIQEIEEYFGFHKIKPTLVYPEENVEEDGDPYREWYEQELREYYERCTGNKSET